MPDIEISTSPCPALAIANVPTPNSRCAKDWSTCSNRTSECRTSRVRFDKMPFRKMDRLLVILSVVVMEPKCHNAKTRTPIAGNNQNTGMLSWVLVFFPNAAIRLVMAIQNKTIKYLIGRVRKVEGCSKSKSCSLLESPRPIDCIGGAGVVGAGGAVVVSSGIRSLLPQPGHLAIVPAYFSGAFIVLEQPGHSTRIVDIEIFLAIGIDFSNLISQVSAFNMTGLCVVGKRHRIKGTTESHYTLDTEAHPAFNMDIPFLGRSTPKLRRHDAQIASAPAREGQGVRMS